MTAAALLVCGFLIAVVFVPKPEGESVPYPIYGLIISVALSFLWMLFGTGYSIEAKILKWRQGPLNGRISIESIRKIEYDDSFIKYQTWKPALHHKGLVIYYNKFDDIFISPMQRDVFVEMLIGINPEIEVFQNQTR